MYEDIVHFRAYLLYKPCLYLLTELCQDEYQNATDTQFQMMHNPPLNVFSYKYN